MRGVHGFALLLAVGLLSGCTGGEGSGRETRLGGPEPAASPTPAEPMDSLETRVARRLAPGLRAKGLTLEYVDCPPWTGAVPATLTCKGYVDGVVGEVQVALSGGEQGSVEFDASLVDVLATSRVVEHLREAGYSRVDCGRTPAYPVRAGMRIVCQGYLDASTQRVVVRVTESRGLEIDSS